MEKKPRITKFKKAPLSISEMKIKLDEVAARVNKKSHLRIEMDEEGDQTYSGYIDGYSWYTTDTLEKVIGHFQSIITPDQSYKQFIK